MAKHRRAHIEIGNVCNLQCSFCPEVERPKKLMQASEFSRLAPSLQGLVDEVSLHLMGEPLYHPEFAEFVSICEAHALPINLTTNGLLLHGERRETVLRSIVRQLNISVHSFEANFAHRDVRPYMEKIISFLREALTRRPDLYINLRVWDMQATDSLQPSSQTIRSMLEEEFSLSIDPTSIDIRRRKNLALFGRVYLHFDSRFTWPSPELPLRSRQGFCHGLTQHFGIHADGTVVPCCLDKEAVIKLGNVHDEDLASILSNPRAESMRQGFARGELVEDLCQRCPFVSRFDGKARRLQHNARASAQKTTTHPVES